MLRRSILVLLLAGVGLSCETTDDQAFVKDGVDYAATASGSFRGRWWSYYERGSNLLKGGFYEAAEADLQKAIQGRRRDAWQARTYGLHFEEYFPTRELGVVFFHQGRLDEAQVQLEQSLLYIDTARAHFYLDEVKRAKLASGAMNDTTAPAVDTTIDDGMVVATLDLPFEIVAKDDVGVASMTVNDEPLYQRGSEEAHTYKKEIPLTEGPHEIKIEAVDLSEKTTAEVQTVVVDVTGPTIGIREPADAFVTEQPTVQLTGTSADQYGVSNVGLGDTVLAQSGAGEGKLPFASALSLQDGENSFVVTARDVAGNENRKEINVFKGDPDSTTAKLWLIKMKDPSMLRLASASPDAIDAIIDLLRERDAKPGPSIRLAVDRMTDAFQVAANDASGTLAITLKSPSADRPWRNSRAVRVAGEVVSNTKIARLTVNGAPVDQLTGESRESFNRRVPIDPAALTDGKGTVRVTIEAVDEAGAKVTQELEVSVEAADTDTRNSRMKLAVLAFTGSADEALRNELRALAETALGDSGRFNVLSREELTAALTEQGLSDALGDKNAALNAGKSVPAHAFIVADVIARGPQAEVYLRVVRTDNEDQIATVDALVENAADAAAMKAGVRQLVEQLKISFPRVNGAVSGARGPRVTLDFGASSGLKEGMHALILRQEEPWIDEKTGEVLDEGQLIPIGEVIVTRVNADSAEAERVQRDDIQEEAGFEQGMAAITM